MDNYEIYEFTSVQTKDIIMNNNYKEVVIMFEKIRKIHKEDTLNTSVVVLTEKLFKHVNIETFDTTAELIISAYNQYN